MNMSIYWLQRIGELNTLCNLITIFAMFGWLTPAIIYVISKVDDFTFGEIKDEYKINLTKIFGFSLSVFIVSIILSMFIPSKEDIKMQIMVENGIKVIEVQK